MIQFTGERREKMGKNLDDDNSNNTLGYHVAIYLISIIKPRRRKEEKKRERKSREWSGKEDENWMNNGHVCLYCDSRFVQLPEPFETHTRVWVYVIAKSLVFGHINVIVGDDDGNDNNRQRRHGPQQLITIIAVFHFYFTSRKAFK